MSVILIITLIVCATGPRDLEEDWDYPSYNPDYIIEPLKRDWLIEYTNK